MSEQQQTLKKKSGGLDEFLNTKLVPAMAKIGNQRHLSSIRDGFALITPLIIAGAVAVLVITVVFGGWGAHQSSIHGLFAEWSNTAVTKTSGASLAFYDSRILGTVVSASIFSGTLGSISIYLPLALGYFLARSRRFEHPVMAALVALGCFVIATGGQTSFYGTSGVFASLVVGIVATEVFVSLCKVDKLLITLPEGVPPAVAKAFSKMIPVILTAIIIAALNAIFIVPTYLTDATATQSKQYFEQVTDPTYINKVQTLWAGTSHELGKTTSVVTQSGTVENLIAAPSTLEGYSRQAWEMNTAKDQIVSIYRPIAKFYEVDKVVNGGNGWTFADAMNIGLQEPFLKLASDPSANFGLAILYVFLIGFFWFFGLHGTNIVNGVFVFWLPLLLQNIDNKAAGVGDSSVVSADYPAFVGGTFDAYIFLGGTCATLGWIFMTMILKRRKEEVEVAKFALPSGVFQINEPVTFGVPMVANPVYVIPWMFTMPILVVSTYLALDVFEAVPPTIVQIPWTIPVGIGGLFATGFAYQGLLLAIANLLIAMLIWTPFILLSGRINNARLRAQGKKVPIRRKMTPERREKLCHIAKRRVGAQGALRYIRKNVVLIGASIILGALLISLSVTWGDSDAGIALGALEGGVILLLPLVIFYGKFIWHHFMRAINH